MLLVAALALMLLVAVLALILRLAALPLMLRVAAPALMPLVVFIKIDDRREIFAAAAHRTPSLIKLMRQRPHYRGLLGLLSRIHGKAQILQH